MAVTDDFLGGGQNFVEIRNVRKDRSILDFNSKSRSFAMDYREILNFCMVDLKRLIGFDYMCFKVLSMDANKFADII